MDENTKRAFRRHWTTSGGRDCDVEPPAEVFERENRRDVMTAGDGKVWREYQCNLGRSTVKPIPTFEQKKDISTEAASISSAS